MHRGQHQRANVRQIEPQCELAPKHAAVLAIASAGHDLHAAHAVGMGGMQKPSQRVKCLLRGHTMQIEPPRAGQLAAAKSLPAGGIDAGRLTAHAGRGALAGIGLQRHGLSPGAGRFESYPRQGGRQPGASSTRSSGALPRSGAIRWA